VYDKYIEDYDLSQLVVADTIKPRNTTSRRIVGKVELLQEDIDLITIMPAKLRKMTETGIHEEEQSRSHAMYAIGAWLVENMCPIEQIKRILVFSDKQGKLQRSDLDTYIHNIVNKVRSSREIINLKTAREFIGKIPEGNTELAIQKIKQVAIACNKFDSVSTDVVKDMLVEKFDFLKKTALNQLFKSMSKKGDGNRIL